MCQIILAYHQIYLIGGLNEFYFSSANLSYRVEGKKYAWLQKLGISAATIGVYLL